MTRKHPKQKERPGVDRLGRTELHYAACDGDVTNATKLIATGARVGVADDNGWTPLHFAAQSQSVLIAQALLAAGAPVDPQDRHGNTPLSTAVFNSRGKGELIDLLRRHGADPTRENLHGVSPLKLARTVGNYDVGAIF